MFETEQSVCEWFLKGLHQHLLLCCSCVQRPVNFQTSDINLSCVSRSFEIDIHSVRFHVPLRFVEAHSFSFCRLFRFFHSFLSKLQTIAITFGQWAVYAETAIIEVPLWFVSSEDDILQRVSFSSASTLRSVLQPLYRYPFHATKSQLVRLLTEDFVRERDRFWAHIVSCDKPWTVDISNYYSLRYGEAFACTLRDIRSSCDFESPLVDVELSKMYGDLWLTLTESHL